MIVVLDASVAIKWFEAEDDASQAAALELLDDIVAGRLELASQPTQTDFHPADSREERRREQTDPHAGAPATHP